MHRYLKARLLASALVLAAVPAVAVSTPSEAAVGFSVSFHYFHDNLSDYGDWLYSRRWGRVWRPDVDANFRPYTRGYWVDTDDYGWLWVSNEPFGDITYHYGRWVYDPYDGWLWIPGYVWSPAWVVWRSGSDYTGWMPMPPTQAFLEGDETDYDISDDYDYGYRRWYPDYSNTIYASLWIFVGNRYIGDRDYHRYAVRRPRITNIIYRTRNVTNYTIVNNYVVNRSVNANVVQRAGGRVHRVRAASVIKRPDLITRADSGREIQMRMRKEAPHGTGRPDSAPRPTAEQIQTLSPTIRTRGGKTPANLLTRAKAQELHREPNAAKPEETTAGKPRTPAEQMRERRRLEREGIAPGNAAKPAAEISAPNKPAEAMPAPAKPAPTGNAPEERRNNALRRMNRVPNDKAAPEKPAAEAQRPERIQRPMESVQPKENAAPAPMPAQPEAMPAQPDRSKMRDQMRERQQEQMQERRQQMQDQTRARQQEQMQEQRQQMQNQMRERQQEQMQERSQQMRERAQPQAAEPRQTQRPAENERHGNRSGEKKPDKNNKPD